MLNFGDGIDESEATWVLLLLKMKRENVLFKVTVWYSHSFTSTPKSTTATGKGAFNFDQEIGEAFL